MVLHTLEENGVSDVSQLLSYIKLDVFRFCGQLHDLRRKLEYAYEHQVTLCIFIDFQGESRVHDH